MKIIVPMQTREAIRDFVLNAARGTIEELFEALGIDAEGMQDDEDEHPTPNDDDIERLVIGLGDAIRMDTNATKDIENAFLPGMMEMDGATIPYPQMRALLTLGVNPMGLLLTASLIGDFQIELEECPVGSITLETVIVENGSLWGPAGSIFVVMSVGKMHWEEEFIRILGHAIPHVSMPRYAHGPYDALIDHDLTRGLGLTISEINQEQNCLVISLAEMTKVKVSDVMKFAAGSKENGYATLA